MIKNLFDNENAIFMEQKEALMIAQLVYLESIMMEHVRSNLELDLVQKR